MQEFYCDECEIDFNEDDLELGDLDRGSEEGKICCPRCGQPSEE